VQGDQNHLSVVSWLWLSNIDAEGTGAAALAVALVFGDGVSCDFFEALVRENPGKAADFLA
jgi:hypothetical protein